MIRPLVFCFALFGLAATAEAAPVKLDKLTLGTDFEGGCGCSIWNPKGEFLFWSELGAGDPALVKINGQLRTLKFVSSTEKSRPARLGDRFTRIYADQDARLTIDHKTTFVCGPDDERCEVTRYDVNVFLEDHGKRARARGLKGDCGC